MKQTGGANGKLRTLDIFAGIGGFSLGLERSGGFETVAFCEIDPYCRAVLAKHWPGVPCFEDVRYLRASDIGAVDVICGGYPCQPFSHAGQRRGEEDDRHLWPEFNRLVAELRPTWVIGENVAGHVSMGLDAVLSDLESQGYACRTFAIPALAVDAKHRRMRVWTVAHAGCKRDEPQRRAGNGSEATGRAQGEARQQRFWAEASDASEAVADAARELLNGGGQPGQGWGGESANGSSAMADAANNGAGWWQQQQEGCESEGRVADTDQQRLPQREGKDAGRERPNGGTVAERGFRWEPEPGVGRVATGIPDRVDRLRALGNAVVPQIPEMIGMAILETDRRTA